jgi:hypothetical protein
MFTGKDAPARGAQPYGAAAAASVRLWQKTNRVRAKSTHVYFGP